MKFQCSLKCKEMLLFQHQLFLLIKLCLLGSEAMLIFILIFLISECERLANEALLLENQHLTITLQQLHLFILYCFSSLLFSQNVALT